MASRVLLVAPPWRLPYTANLALGTLGPILRGAGFEVHELHGALLFPVVASTFDVLETYAKFLFGRRLNNTSVEDLLVSLRRSIAHHANTGDPRNVELATWESLGFDTATIEERFRRDLASAEHCLDAMTDRVLAYDYDVVGFSATFDAQVPASLAVAARIKALRPETKIVLGGAACFEDQADGLLASFSVIDAVCHTEGESVIIPLFEALCEGRTLTEVPGVVWRDGVTVRHNPSPPLLRDLDQLPIPDYREFIAAFEASHWGHSHKPLLMFETSRGCWWGQKKLCTFCGLNGEGLSFRAKSSSRAFDEIVHLYETYPTANYLQATDNILEMKYLSEVFPRLVPYASATERPLRMFYEVKSNMKAEHVRAMAAGGVDCVQPGIESFSDGVLGLMNKGCTALGQIQFIKWTYQERIDPKYNIIVGNPGEQPTWYDAMTELVPWLEHLPPPTGIVNMQLERFSPYFQDPARYGITNVRPRRFYADLYPATTDLDRIAYQFEFDHPDQHDPSLLGSLRQFLQVAQRWKTDWKADTAFYMVEGEDVLVVDRRSPLHVITRLTGPHAQLFHFLDQHRARAQIAELMAPLEDTFVDVLLDAWCHHRWLCTIDGRYLNVLPRRGAPPMVVATRRPREQRVSLPMLA